MAPRAFAAWLLTVLLSGAIARADVDNPIVQNTPEDTTAHLSSHVHKARMGDLDQIVKNRFLRVLTTKNPYDYFVSHGEMKGVQYEMVREFVAQLNRKYVKRGELKIAFELVPVDFDELIPMLNAGKGDLIAVGMTRTAEREAEVKFTRPYEIVHDAIVTRAELADEPWEGKTFYVQEDSSYLEALNQSKKKVSIKEVEADFNAENMMQLVSVKTADYTLVNSYWAKSIVKRFKNLVILDEKPFRKKVPISWAVRKKNPKLLKELNGFIPKVRRGSLLGNTFGQRYFDDVSRLQSEDFDLPSQRISKYDEYFKKYAKKYDLDWRLLAAICLQESRFEQDQVNKWGAIGLFQMKQTTADEPYVSVGPIRGIENSENNIHAGAKYLSWLKKTHFDVLKNLTEEEKLRLMVASYNAGPSRVKEAIARAKKDGLRPDVWFRNVEVAMLELGYSEPVIYVSEINKHYVSYLLMGIQ